VRADPWLIASPFASEGIEPAAQLSERGSRVLGGLNQFEDYLLLRLILDQDRRVSRVGSPTEWATVWARHPAGSGVRSPLNQPAFQGSYPLHQTGKDFGSVGQTP
jgi:hypothetical protein